MKIAPAYPPEAREQGLGGYVVVEIDVDPFGDVCFVRVIETSNRVFNQASIEAAERFKFEPPLIDGVPVPFSIRNIFNYQMGF
ncbi:MAG: energy transducer TonB [Gemmatimonadota bacterium]|nr:energy transducer TonB [Gemmatimonadota bacterium]